MTLRHLALATLLLGLLLAPAAPAAPVTPAVLHAAYDLPVRAPSARLVAVITAYDDPTVEADLGRSAQRFGLPRCTSSGPTPCFRRVNQDGAARPLPGRDLTGGNWITEAALGTQVVRGVCQNCRILLVEANAPSRGSLAVAIATAARLGAREIVTAFSPVETGGDAGYGGSLTPPGVVVTAATGDNGYAAEPAFPASMPGVVAVGGTRLTVGRDGSYRGETAWSGSGNGCSTVFSAPPWQAPLARSVGCGAARAVADVAAVAEPGFLIVSSTPIGGETGWFEARGTSLSSPVIAATFALAGGVPAGVRPGERLLRRLGDPAALHDVTRGVAGSCGGRPVCATRRGYDGPTGVGTPRGIGAFGGRAGTIPGLRHGRPGVGLRSTRVRAGRDGRLRVGLTNRNGFAVSARLTLRVSGVRGAPTAGLTLRSHGRGAPVFRLAMVLRHALVRRSPRAAVLEIAARGPGETVARGRTTLRILRP